MTNLKKLLINCYNKLFKNNLKVEPINLFEPIYNSNTKLQNSLINITNDLVKTKRCPFCNNELVYYKGFGYYADEHITLHSFEKSHYYSFRLNKLEIEIFPGEKDYYIFQFSDWYDHYVKSNEEIIVPQDMEFKNIQELKDYLIKVMVFS